MAEDEMHVTWMLYSDEEKRVCLERMNAKAVADRSLRDHFAGLAMQELCTPAAVERMHAATNALIPGAAPADIRSYIASAAYDMADAMMAERAKRLAVKP